MAKPKKKPTECVICGEKLTHNERKLVIYYEGKCVRHFSILGSAYYDVRGWKTKCDRTLKWSEGSSDAGTRYFELAISGGTPTQTIMISMESVLKLQAGITDWLLKAAVQPINKDYDELEDDEEELPNG